MRYCRGQGAINLANGRRIVGPRWLLDPLDTRTAEQWNTNPCDLLLCFAVGERAFKEIRPRETERAARGLRARNQKEFRIERAAVGLR